MPWEPRPSKDEFAFASHLQDLDIGPNYIISFQGGEQRRARSG